MYVHVYYVHVCFFCNRFGIDSFKPVDKCFTTFPSDTLDIPALVTDRNTLNVSFGMERVFYAYSPTEEQRGIVRRRGQLLWLHYLYMI